MSIEHSHIVASRDLCSNLNDTIMFMNSMPEQASEELKSEVLSLLTLLVEELSLSLLLLSSQAESETLLS